MQSITQSPCSRHRLSQGPLARPAGRRRLVFAALCAVAAWLPAMPSAQAQGFESELFGLVNAERLQTAAHAHAVDMATPDCLSHDACDGTPWRAVLGPQFKGGGAGFQDPRWTLAPGNVAPVPEPSTWAFLALGLVALALRTRRRAWAAGSLAGLCLPALAQGVWIDFDHRADGSPLTLATGTDLWNADVGASLQGFGVTVQGLSHPDLSQRIGHHANLIPGSGSNSFFVWAGGGTPPAASTIVYRLGFERPVDDLSFVRAGLTVGTSSKAWDLAAYDSAGHELGRVGEPVDASSGWDGRDWSLRPFALPWDGIAFVEVRSNFGGNGNSTYLSPPLDDLRFTVSAVPEPGSWLLMALGLAAGALRLRSAAREQAA